MVQAWIWSQGSAGSPGDGKHHSIDFSHEGWSFVFPLTCQSLMLNLQSKMAPRHCANNLCHLIFDLHNSVK